MSGHANFHTIGGFTALHLPPSPQVEDDIHVAGNQPVGGANGGGIGVGPQDGPQNARVDAQAESTKALVRQLDILLARAAASATQSVDATAVKAALGELGLPEDKRKALADDDYAKVVGGLMRQTSRLEWFDLITGQGDRHGGNYFVEVDPRDFTVTLKGIDNDASFPAYRKGLRTFALDENTSTQFTAKR